ncbi:hypothetical protein Tco_0742426 [Tanacetum coccineum]
MSDSEDSTVTYTAVSSPFGCMSDIGSPGVDGPPVMLEDPYAYVVAALVMPPKDDVLPAEEQPLPVAISPTAVSPGYIADSNLKEDEEDPEENPIDYPVDRGDDDDDDDESSDDEEDDDDVEVDLSLMCHWVSGSGVECRLVIHYKPGWGATMVRTESACQEAFARLLDISSPPPSPLSPWSSPLPQIPSPSLLVSSPVPVSPPPLPTSPT